MGKVLVFFEGEESWRSSSEKESRSVRYQKGIRSMWFLRRKKREPRRSQFTKGLRALDLAWDHWCCHLSICSHLGSAVPIWTPVNSLQCPYKVSVPLLQGLCLSFSMDSARLFFSPPCKNGLGRDYGWIICLNRSLFPNIGPEKSLCGCNEWIKLQIACGMCIPDGNVNKYITTREQRRKE